MYENEELNSQEPSTASELSNMGRKAVGTVGNAANLALGMGKKLHDKKKDDEKKNKKDEDKKDENGQNKKGDSNSDGKSSIDDETDVGKNIAKKGANVVKEGVKATGKGLNALWNFIPFPYNVISIMGIALVLIVFFVIFLGTGASQSDCSSKYYSCSSISVKMSDGSIANVPFEEYIAGVVASEAFTEENIEALKAQAVAARTFAIVSTNDCTLTIGSDTYAQVYKPTTDAKAIQAAQETEGQVLTYEGKLFLSQYDSFCYADSNCPDSTKNSDGTYTVTYTKQPSYEKHSITLSASRLYFQVTNVAGQGHGNGMSQLLSYELAEKGWDYEQILEYFYSDGVEISSPSNGEQCSIGDSDALEYAMEMDFEGDYWNYWANNTTRLEGTPLRRLLGSDGIENLNQYITNQVESVADPGEKVASAGMGLALYLYNEGYRLPYYWGGGWSVVSSGANGNWGGSTSASCNSARCYYYDGFDCAGFVKWSLKNAGCSNYMSINPFSSFIANNAKRSSLSDLKPGDILMSSGHVILVVGYREDLDRVVTVESAGGTNGLVVRAFSSANISAGGYYKINMDSYYNNYCS